MKNRYRLKLLKQHAQPDWDETHGCCTIAKLAKLFHVKHMAEIGVAYGHTATEVLNATRIARYHMIDTWPNEEIYKTITDNFSADPTITITRKDSIEAAKGFENESLDMIYLDTYHTYQQTIRETHAWIPKLKHGGVFAGDGYGYKLEGKDQVKQAVHEIFRKQQININLGKDYIYWIIRP